MDNWIKVLEQELAFVGTLKDLLINELNKLKQQGPFDTTQVGLLRDLYTELYSVMSFVDRLITQRDVVLSYSSNMNSLEPTLAWAALNYFMLNSSVDYSELFIGQEFEIARRDQVHVPVDSTLHHTIYEITRKINDSQLPRLMELEAAKEKQGFTIQSLRILLGV